MNTKIVANNDALAEVKKLMKTVILIRLWRRQW